MKVGGYVTAVVGHLLGGKTMDEEQDEIIDADKLIEEAEYNFEGYYDDSVIEFAEEDE